MQIKVIDTFVFTSFKQIYDNHEAKQQFHHYDIFHVDYQILQKNNYK